MVKSENSYYPFNQYGSLQPGRNDNAGDYRFGFNGQEMDNEVSGTGNTNTAMFWEYDSRLGRRWNMDPVKTLSESPYICFGGNPIIYSDVKGDFKSKISAFLFNASRFFKGSIHQAVSGEYEGQYYVMMNNKSERYTNRGTLLYIDKNSVSDDKKVKLLDVHQVSTTIVFGWGYFGEGVYHRTKIGKMNDIIWDALVKLEKIILGENKIIKTNDPVPADHPDQHEWDNWGQTDPIVSDRVWGNDNPENVKPDEKAAERPKDTMYIWEGRRGKSGYNNSYSSGTAFDSIINDPNPPKDLGPKPELKDKIVIEKTIKK